MRKSLTMWILFRIFKGVEGGFYIPSSSLIEKYIRIHLDISFLFRIFVLMEKTRQMHLVAQLYTNDKTGEYYVVTNPHSDDPTSIRKYYLPIGPKLIYPKRWGKKAGALELLKAKIEDQKRILHNANKELSKLQACEVETLKWKDD
jgi:hypothetical protein